MSNDAYIKVKLDQIDEQKKALRAQLKALDAKRKAYSEQLVDETDPDPQTGDED